MNNDNIMHDDGMARRIANMLNGVSIPPYIIHNVETKYFEKNFFLLKEGDEIFEITVAGNIDPGAWEDL